MAWSSVKRVYDACEMNANHRPSMEDEHRVVDKFFQADPSSAFFAVYDGHGGRGVVDFIKDRLEQNIIMELEDRINFNRSVEECLTSAFLITDIETSKQNLITSGSTAVTCLLLDRTLYCANAGDSRAVLSRNGKAVRLSFDHKASEESEAERIARSGGFVRAGRVMGMVTVSRSFGDHIMKHLVTAVPFVSKTDLMREEDEFLILACDGLWDVFTDQEAVDFCKAKQSGDGAVDLARALIDECLLRRTTDNVSVIVVQL